MRSSPQQLQCDHVDSKFQPLLTPHERLWHEKAEKYVQAARYIKGQSERRQALQF